jgi:hypothetical protein
VSVTLLEPGLIALLDSPAGQVGRYITRQGEAVAELARQNAQALFHSRTGNLFNSIGVFPRETPDGLEVEVGTDGAPYGLLLEQGSDTPHEIVAVHGQMLWSESNNPDPLLKSGLFAVPHYGYPARPWLEPALRQVILGA